VPKLQSKQQQILETANQGKMKGKPIHFNGAGLEKLHLLAVTFFLGIIFCR